MGALILLAILVSIYFLPTIIGHQRKVSNLGSIAVINALLGLTLIGWVVALAMAVKDRPIDVKDVQASDSRLQGDTQRAVVARQPTAPEPSMPAGDALLTGIQALADLRERGHLTEEEFAAAKARLLGGDV